VPIERKEIPKSVKLFVFERAGGRENLRCEGCGLPLGAKRFHYDHTLPEWLQLLPKQDRPPIRPEDVKLLGWDCCHKPKTAQEATARGRDNRLAEKTAGIQRKPKWRCRPMPGTRASGWKRTLGNQNSRPGWVRR
jgi:hypothetical protein